MVLRCKNIDPVHRVSIVPRGAAALGMTMVRPLEDRHIMTKDELEDRMTFALGGRSSEEIVFGDFLDQVDCALRQYIAHNAFRIASPADLVDALSTVFPDAAARLAPYGLHP